MSFLILAQRCKLSADFGWHYAGSFVQERVLKYTLLLYMSILALAGAASLSSITPGIVLKRDTSVGEHPAVCDVVSSVHGNIKGVQLSTHPCLVMVGCWGMGAMYGRQTLWKTLCNSSEPQLRAATAVVQWASLLYFVARSLCARDHKFLFVTAITAAMRFASKDNTVLAF